MSSHQDASPLSGFRAAEDERIHIGVLHGDVNDKSGYGPVSRDEIAACGLHYLALGHVHQYSGLQKDGRTFWAYPGCPEGRGFDECGEHGYVLLDINLTDGICSREFVKIATRSLYELEADVSGCMNTMEISRRISGAIESCCYGKENLIKIILTGTTDVECEKNIDLLTKQFENEFYYVKIQDDTHLKIDYEMYAYDESLKGEFIRMVRAREDLSNDDKAQIIRYGIQALSGEEIE